MASQYFFRLGKHTPRPDDAAIFLPSNDLEFHGNVLEGGFIFIN